MLACFTVVSTVINLIYLKQLIFYIVVINQKNSYKCPFNNSMVIVKVFVNALPSLTHTIIDFHGKKPLVVSVFPN